MSLATDVPSSAIEKQLTAAGMSEPAAVAKAKLFDDAQAALGGEPATIRWFVPGRIEFLGKHTDYAGGRSLLCTVEQGFCIVARPRTDTQITIRLVDGRSAVFPLDASLKPAAGEWSNYPMTVAQRVASNFPGDLRGVDIAFASDLPPAAGMSSSSALVVGTFMVLADANDLTERREYRDNIKTHEDLCGYLGTCENGKTFGTLRGAAGVGTFGGSEDHTAILSSQAGYLAKFSFGPVRRESMHRLPRGYEFVIGASGVVAEKTRAAKEKYNRVSRTAGVILEQWHAAGGKPVTCLADAIRSSTDAPERLRHILAASAVPDFPAAELVARLAQFIGESERIIPGVAAAIDAGRLDQVGDLVDQSQQGAENALGNQVPQTIELAASARRLGATAASSFGAGFGGSVWALVKSEDAEDFSRRWAANYAKKFPTEAANARFFRTAAGPAAVSLS